MTEPTTSPDRFTIPAPYGTATSHIYGVPLGWVWDKDVVEALAVGLLRPLRAHLADLLMVRAEGLTGVLAWSAGTEGSDRCLIGAASSLLAATAGRQPVLVVVDDKLWVDRESPDALLLAARRLGHDKVAMVATHRRGEPTTSLDGFDVVSGGSPPTAAVRMPRSGTPAWMSVGPRTGSSPGGRRAPRAGTRPTPRGPDVDGGSCNDIGRDIAQRLGADGKAVVDAPAELSARRGCSPPSRPAMSNLP